MFVPLWNPPMPTSVQLFSSHGSGRDCMLRYLTGSSAAAAMQRLLVRHTVAINLTPQQAAREAQPPNLPRLTRRRQSEAIPETPMGFQRAAALWCPFGYFPGTGKVPRLQAKQICPPEAHGNSPSAYYSHINEYCIDRFYIVPQSRTALPLLFLCPFDQFLCRIMNILI